MPTVNIERLRKLDYRCNEAYKTLRTNIQLCGSDMKVIMLQVLHRMKENPVFLLIWRYRLQNPAKRLFSLMRI